MNTLMSLLVIVVMIHFIQDMGTTEYMVMMVMIKSYKMALELNIMMVVRVMIPLKSILLG